MRRRAPRAKEGERVERRIDGGNSYYLSSVSDIQCSTLSSRTQRSKIVDLTVLPQHSVSLRTAEQRIDFAVLGESRNPPTSVDRVGSAVGRAVSTRKRTEIGKNTVLPPEGVAKKAIRACAIWCIGIGCGRVRRAHHDSRTVKELACSDAITLPTGFGSA